MNTQTSVSGTLTLPRTVCRVGIGHRALEVSVERGATEDTIRSLVLEEAPNHVFTEHSAEYELPDCDSGKTGELKSALVGLLQGLADQGFGTDRPITIDAIDAVQDIFRDFLQRNAESLGVYALVIHSESENGFWIRDSGWGSGDDAQIYFERPQLAGMPSDARLIPFALKGTFGHVAQNGMEGMTLQDAIDQADDPSVDVYSLRAAAEILAQIECPAHKDLEALRIIQETIAAA